MDKLEKKHGWLHDDNTLLYRISPEKKSFMKSSLLEFGHLFPLKSIIKWGKNLQEP